jgi:hypothetical protein
MTNDPQIAGRIYVAIAQAGGYRRTMAGQLDQFK